MSRRRPNLNYLESSTNYLFDYAKKIRALNLLREAKGELPVAFDLQRAIKATKRRIAKHRGTTSKYRPHQGVNECTRRRMQNV